MMRDMYGHGHYVVDGVGSFGRSRLHEWKSPCYAGWSPTWYRCSDRALLWELSWDFPRIIFWFPSNISIILIWISVKTWLLLSLRITQRGNIFLSSYFLTSASAEVFLFFFYEKYHTSRDRESTVSSTWTSNRKYSTSISSTSRIVPTWYSSRETRGYKWDRLL